MGFCAQSLKGYSLHCIIFRTATNVACGTGVLFPYYMERGAYLKHLFLNEFNGVEKYIFVAAVKDLRYNKKLTGNFYKGGRIEK